MVSRLEAERVEAMIKSREKTQHNVTCPECGHEFDFR